MRNHLNGVFAAVQLHLGIACRHDGVLDKDVALQQAHFAAGFPAIGFIKKPSLCRQ